MIPMPICAVPSTPWWTAPCPPTTACAISDQYRLLLDYDSYVEAKLRANRDYADRMAFGRKCLENVASAAKFSSDRTIRQYAEEIWHIKPVQY